MGPKFSSFYSHYGTKKEEMHKRLRLISSKYCDVQIKFRGPLKVELSNRLYYSSYKSVIDRYKSSLKF